MVKRFAGLGVARFALRVVLFAALLPFPLISFGSVVSFVAPAEYYFDGSLETGGPTTYTRTDAVSSGYASFSLTPAPNLHVHTETAAENLYDTLKEGADSAALRYYYRILGLAPGDTVQASISTQMSVTAGLTGSLGGYELQATLSGDNIPLSAKTSVCLATSGSDCVGRFTSVKSVFSVALPEFGSFLLSAQAQGDGFSGDAYIDPVISLPDGYLIEFSPGVGNSFAAPSAAVPEPATVGLLCIGLLGFAGSRRKVVHSKAA